MNEEPTYTGFSNYLKHTGEEINDATTQTRRACSQSGASPLKVNPILTVQRSVRSTSDRCPNVTSFHLEVFQIFHIQCFVTSVIEVFQMLSHAEAFGGAISVSVIELSHHLQENYKLLDI